LLTSDLQLVAVHDRDLRALLGQPGAQASVACLAAERVCSGASVATTLSRGTLSARHSRLLPSRCLLTPPLKPQVSQYTWQQLQGLSWPGGERLLSVAQAVALVQDRVRLLIVDVKSSAAPGAKVGEGGGGALCAGCEHTPAWSACGVIHDAAHSWPAAQVVAQGSADSDVTEADALLAELRQLRLGANSCVWGKSDELVLRAHKVGQAGLTRTRARVRDCVLSSAQRRGLTS
jgi:hypothetical protein